MYIFPIVLLLLIIGISYPKAMDDKVYNKNITKESKNKNYKKRTIEKEYKNKISKTESKKSQENDSEDLSSTEEEININDSEDSQDFKSTKKLKKGDSSFNLGDSLDQKLINKWNGGGSKPFNYNGDNINKLKKILEMPKVKNITVENAIKIKNLKWIKFFNPPSGVQNRNDASIIVKPTIDQCSSLLTGDATEQTYKNIKIKKELESTILLAAHHGSDSHGSNSEEYLKKISPKAVIISSGHHEKHRHPRCKAVESIASILRNKHAKTKPHSLTCGIKGNDKEWFNAFKSGYAEEKSPIFSTYDEGSIHLELTNESFNITSKGTSILKGKCN